jgi:SAM-dependent methyltransferase
MYLLSTIIPRGNGSTAVDIGCNDGTITKLIADCGYEPVGFDLDPRVVAKATENYPGLDFRVGSVSDTRGVDRSLTVCLELIEHLECRRQYDFIGELAETVPSATTLLISTPGRHSLISLYERLSSRTWRSYDWWDATHVGVMPVRRFRRLLAPAFNIQSFIGFYYAPQRLVKPFGTRRWPLSAMGFDLIVVATRR